MTKEALELGEQNQHHQASNKRSFTAAAFSPEQTSLIELAVGPSANNGTNNAIDSENNTEYNAEYTFALGSELNRPSSVTASPSHSLSLSLSYSQPATPSPPGSPSYSDTFVYVDNNDGVESGTNDNANDSANNILGAHISKRNLPGSGSVRSVGSPTSSTTTGSATHRLQSVTLSNSNFTSVYSDVKSQFLSPGDVVHLLPSKFWLAFEKHVQYGSAMPGLVDFSRLKAYCEANSNSHGLISASLEDVEGFVLIKSSIFTKLQISFPMFPKDESTRTFPVCIVSALTRDDFKGSFATAKININPIQLRVYKLPVAAFTEVPVAITVASRDWSSDIVQRVVRRHLDAKSVRLFRLDIDTVASTDLSDENFPLLNLPPVQLPGVDYSSLLLGVEISERFDEDEELSCLVLVASAKIPDSNTLLGATKKIDSSNETHSSSLFPLQKKETAQEKRARIRKHEADFANGVESESRDESEIKKPLLLGAADPMDTGVVRIPASDQDYRFPGVGKTIGSVGYSGMTAPNIPARPKTTPGATGLNNLGNTCFMNSALQCLSNSAHLTAFFLSDRWKDELNADNPLGMNGEVARAYAALMRDLWTGVTNNSEDSYYYGSRGGGNSVAPRNFKNTIGRFNQTFVGYSQQDSQELLQFLLDGLHEDLNRILKKPYVEQPDMDGKPDDEIATKAWELYRLRNDSQIVDLFQGEYKSRVECIDCGNWSVKFDPYMFLSLPVPERREITVNLIVVGSCFRRKSSQNSELKTNLSSITENLVIDESPSLSKTFSTDSLPIPTDLHSILAYERPKRITITVPRDATIQILKLKVAEKMGWTLGKIPGLSATRRLIVSEIYNNKIFKSFTDWDRVSEMQKNDVVYVYELTDPPYNDLGIVVPASVALKSTFVPVYLRINNMRENSYGNDINNLIGVPILIPVPAEFGSAVSVPAEIAEHVSDYLWSELAFNQLGAPLYELVVASLRRYSKIPLYQDVRVDAVSGNDLVDLYSSNYKNPTWTPGPPPPAAEPLSPFSDIDNEPYGPQLTRDSAPVVSEEQPRKLDARSGSLFENLQPLDESEATTSVKDLFTLKYFLGETNLAPMDIKDRFYQNPNTYRAKKGQFGSDGSVDSNIFTRPKLSQKQAQTFEFKNGVPEEQTAETDDDDSEDNVEYLIASKSENTHTLKFNGWKLNQRARDGFVVYPVALEDGGKGKDGADVPHMETINMNSELVIVAEFSLEAAAMLFGDEILERGVTTLEVFEPDRDSANSTDFDTRRDSAGGENVSKIIALDDCLKEFMREEIMGDDDTWYCPKCKEHKKIKKKLDIWSVPDTLVLHLKRFSQTGRGFRSMSSNKIDALVDFPVNNLDLSEFVIGRDWMKQQESTHVDGNEENGDNGRLIYDLFGVSNHYGGMGGGHYTAFAKNPIDQEWYNFDDSSVTKTSESNVVTSAAYMLFYQRRSKKSSHNLEEMIELRKNSAPESSITKKVTPYSVYQSSSSSTDLSSMNWRPEYSSTVPIGFSKISSFRPIMPVSPSTSEAGHSDDENRIKLAVPVATLDNPAGWEFGSHKKYEALESSSPVHEIHLDGDDDYDGLPSLENAKEADEDMDMFNLS